MLWPVQVQVDTPLGGKGRALAELMRAGLPIPDWFAVLPHSFKSCLSVEQAETLASVPTAETMRTVLAAFTFSDEVRDAIDQACALLGGANARFAVRSSAQEEDSAAHSFAGQLESFINVDAESVAEQVVAVWRSGFSERIVAYRRQAGLTALPDVPAVLVQRMVTGEVSGVAFSADPVSGRRGVVVVGALPGLGNALVSGEATGDTWRVGAGDTIIERAIAAKDIIQQADASDPAGFRRVSLPASQAREPCLEDAGILQVARLAMAAERHFGRPQDIEWTMDGERLYLLQSRPITGLEQLPDPDGRRAIWDNSNIIESYSGMTTPLTFSFARRAYEYVYREFCRLMGVPQSRIEERSDMFGCMLGLIRGRVYYNLFNWYRLVAILPGYRFNRRFMEQMMGVRESLGDELAAEVAKAEQGNRLVDALRLAGALLNLLLAYAGLGGRIQRFYLRLESALGHERPDLSRLRPDELVAYCRRLEQQLLTHWDAPIINDFATMIFYGVLRRLVSSWVGDTTGTLQNNLLCADQAMISAEPARLVRRMAEMAATEPGLVETLSEASGALPSVVAKYPEFARELDGYLARFGERCMEELKLESPTLHDDPSPLLRSIGQYALGIQAGRPTAAPDVETGLRQQAEAQVNAALAGHPLRRLVFNWVLAHTRLRVRTRENLRFERTRVFGRARMITVELGKRLAALGCLAQARDVFYLEWDELLGFVEGRATTADLAGLVAVRQREFDAHAQAAAPSERFETRGILYRGHSFSPEQQAAVLPEGDRCSGTGCCPGIVRGPVRVIRDPRQSTVKLGEIIVAERTDPGWVMVFPSASGLLVERGSLLSHSAIVARELGLPTIVAIPGVTRWLRDGDWVEMDGSRGTVVRIPAPEGGP
ncbi:PEP/pyruvate-binding domain-containing protein [Formivibrio citricus]|uniref:PEP/pyruvate-binding domain-containing protein n=1 Tax=Formivibrio citricus TaxID=83765 RepID=UPI001C42F543|nr:PEP/pyruvate-binding domain-containing protein [Formivibrio citricus]